MSEVAIVDAVLNELRDGNRKLSNPALSRENSGWEPEGSPPPIAPQLYISVDESGVTNPGTPQQDHLKEQYRISVFINRRTGEVSADRYSDIYRKLNNGLTAIERKIVRALHGNWEVMTAANALLTQYAGGDSVQGFQQPLWYTGRPKTKPRGADWSGETIADGTLVSWVVRELTFVGFLRVTPNDEIT